MQRFFFLYVLVQHALGFVGAAPAPRAVRVDGQRFVLASTNETVVMAGPNIVVKGPPYLPSTSGDTICNDVVNPACTAHGNCTSCETFNEADVKHIKSLGWNTIRLGVVWAGGQPTEENVLDQGFVKRLHAILDLCDRMGLYVVLDLHGDMTGSQGCGNGVPTWFQVKASGKESFGKPLKTGFPYSLDKALRVEDLAGYSHCGDNETKWAKFAGDPNYNLLNECCQAINGPNPAATGWTTMSQATMNYLVDEGPGRDYFVQYWKLLAMEAKRHPSAVACELMNEPMSIRRKAMFDTWRAATEAITAIIPDMAVSITDTGEGAVLPAWLTKLAGAGILIDKDTVDWIKKSNNVFYSWHYYGNPSTPAQAVENALAIQRSWNVPSFATEFGSCAAWTAAREANISHSYWHYSSYCTTGPSFGNRKVPGETFGACILGWAAGDSSKCSHSNVQYKS